MWFVNNINNNDSLGKFINLCYSMNKVTPIAVIAAMPFLHHCLPHLHCHQPNANLEDLAQTEWAQPDMTPEDKQDKTASIAFTD